MLDLDPTAKWRSELKPLDRNDIQSMSNTDTVHPITDLPPNEGDIVSSHGLLPSGIIPEGS